MRRRCDLESDVANLEQAAEHVLLETAVDDNDLELAVAVGSHVLTGDLNENHKGGRSGWKGGMKEERGSGSGREGRRREG